MQQYGCSELLDILVVGSGPAALAALYEAKQHGLHAVAIEKGPVCAALMHHPTYMRWFSTADKLELAGFPLLTNEKNPTRREYLRYCLAFVRHFSLDVVTYHTVTAVKQEADTYFHIDAQDMYGRGTRWRAKNVVVATGFYDTPRPLGVPGEDLAKVTHRYTEAHPYAGQEVLVVGAGSSAVEVALELYRYGVNVTMAMRGGRFVTKYWLEPDIENRIKEGSITCYRHTEVREIRPDNVLLAGPDGATFTVPNDFVLAMTGYEPDTTLIERAGAVVDQESKKPHLTEYFESTVPGLYVAGTLCAGCDSNTVFVENSREHGPVIVQHICDKQATLHA
ncbi:MAG: YpdA family putative bacillithiol disulfide reductase [Candidatus Hydrogenedentota bacterium]